MGRGNSTGHDAGTRTLPWLAHPVTVAALAVLLVNDHVLKAAHPGVLTGKLSDLAGLVVAPPLLATVVALLIPAAPARALATAATVAVGVGFTLVKATTAGASVASAVWSAVNGPSVIRADATDLAALPMLALAWYVSRRVAPAPPRSARLARALLLLPVALLATTATSAPVYGETVWVGHVGDSLVAGLAMTGGGTLAGPFAFVGTLDGGASFFAIPDSPKVIPAPPTQECAGATCFRVVPGRLAVQQSDDGGATWRTAWSVTGPTYADLVRRYPDLGDPSTTLASIGLVVKARPDGVAVLVANGRDGLLRRDPAGVWTRLGNGGPDFDSPPTLRFPPPGAGRSYAMLVGVLALLGGVLTAIGAGPARLSIGWTARLAAGAAAALVAVSIIAAVAGAGRGPAVPVEFGAAGLAVTAFLLAAGALVHRRIWPWWAAVGCVVVAGAGVAIGYVWDGHLADDYSINSFESFGGHAVVLVLFAGAAVVSGLAAGRRPRASTVAALLAPARPAPPGVDDRPEPPDVDDRPRPSERPDPAEPTRAVPGPGDGAAGSGG